MKVRKHSLVVLFCLTVHVCTTRAAADCAGKCEQSRMSHKEAGIKQRAMIGHSFKNFSVSRVYDCHVKCFDEKCRCQAFQMSQSRCELLDADRFALPEDFGHDSTYVYFDMHREYIKQGSKDSACAKDTCSNLCCSLNPCLNGGTCTELCDDVRRKFNCTCAPGYVGKVCEKRARSCKQILENNKGMVLSGVFHIFDSSNNLYEVFCDFTSEKGFIWTVVESFTFANNGEFADKPFYVNHSVNEQAFTWEKYRLSMTRMYETATQSTHFRATCNFNTEGLNYTDYMRAKLSDIDMQVEIGGCKKFEYIDVRGHRCENCSTGFSQTDIWHAHYDSYHASQQAGCPQLSSAKQGAIKLPGGEDDFGWYHTVNPVHRCVSTVNSTTQWWLGEKIG